MAQAIGKPRLFFGDVEIGGGIETSGGIRRFDVDELQFSEAMIFDPAMLPVSFVMPTTTTISVSGTCAELIAGFDSNEIVCEISAGNRWWSKCRRTQKGITKLQPDGSVDIITSGGFEDHSDYRMLARFLRWLEWHSGLFRWVLRGIPRGTR